MKDVSVNVDRYFDPVKPLVDYVKNNPSGDKIDEYLDVLIKVGA